MATQQDNGGSPVNAVQNGIEVVDGLLQQRKQHLEAVKQIDATLRNMTGRIQEVFSNGTARRGHTEMSEQPRTKRRCTRRAVSIRPNRSNYGVTGHQLLMSVLKDGKELNNQQIRLAWKSNGRRGTPDGILWQMSREGLLVRRANPDQAGSIYRLSDTGEQAARQLQATAAQQ